jgi:MscS family membrane protein
VPNGKLTDMIIDNWGMRVFRMYKTVLQIKLGTPRATIEAFVLRLREIVDQHPHTRKEQYMISLFDVGPFAYDVLFYAFIAAPTYNEELRIREGIILQIIQAAEQMGVSFAVPTQQIVLEPVKPQDFPLKP